MVTTASFVFLIILILVLTSVINGAPFVASDKNSIERMLSISKIKKGDRVLDLGSGDGRLVIAFAKKGCSVEGVEINPILVLISKILIGKARVGGRAKVRLGNMWRVNLSNYGIVSIFGMNHIMYELEEKVKREI